MIDILICLAMLAVVTSLGLGVYSLLRGGEFARQNSNKFMRWRVMTQAVAVGLLVIGFAYKASHG